MGNSIWGPYWTHMSRILRKPAFCICENKDADQLRSNCEADQRLCFRYWDSTIYYLNPKFQPSSHLLLPHSPVCVRPGRKPRRPVFSERGSYNAPMLAQHGTLLQNPHHSLMGSPYWTHIETHLGHIRVQHVLLAGLLYMVN